MFLPKQRFSTAAVCLLTILSLSLQPLHACDLLKRLTKRRRCNAVAKGAPVAAVQKGAVQKSAVQKGAMQKSGEAMTAEPQEPETPADPPAEKPAEQPAEQPAEKPGEIRLAPAAGHTCRGDCRRMVSNQNLALFWFGFSYFLKLQHIGCAVCCANDRSH